jgi:hypothetical protein
MSILPTWIELGDSCVVFGESTYHSGQLYHCLSGLGGFVEAIEMVYTTVNLREFTLYAKSSVS